MLVLAFLGPYLGAFIPAYLHFLNFFDRKGVALSLAGHVTIFGISAVVAVVMLLASAIVLGVIGWSLYGVFCLGKWVVAFRRRSN